MRQTANVSTVPVSSTEITSGYDPVSTIGRRRLKELMDLDLGEQHGVFMRVGTGATAKCWGSKGRGYSYEGGHREGRRPCPQLVTITLPDKYFVK